MYGIQSADTTTAVNNEGCCYYCLGRRSEARVRFERSWNVFCDKLGHRHPRSIAAWKNLEKSRKSQSSLNAKDMSESLSLRSDSDRLLIGSMFAINAIPPMNGRQKTGKLKKGGKKKKK